MEKMKVLKNDAVVHLPIGTAFYLKLKDLLVYLTEDKTDEQIKEFEVAINEKKEITEDWMAHLFTVVLLIRALEDKAEADGFLEDKEITLPEN
jgi:hypothetical protein